MKEVIDYTDQPQDFRNIRKSTTVFKFYGFLVLTLILINVLLIGIQIENSLVYSCLVVVVITLMLLLLVAAPVGLVSACKAYSRKESSAGMRLIHVIGHSIFCLIVLAILFTLIRDVARLFIEMDKF